MNQSSDLDWANLNILPYRYKGRPKYVSASLGQKPQALCDFFLKAMRMRKIFFIAFLAAFDFFDN